MHYYRVIEGPTTLEQWTRAGMVSASEGQKVEYFTLLPEGEGLDGDNPVIGCESDLADKQHLALVKMMSVIDVQFGDKNYEYRTQLQTHDEEGNLQKIVLEVENGY